MPTPVRRSYHNQTQATGAQQPIETGEPTGYGIYKTCFNKDCKQHLPGYFFQREPGVAPNQFCVSCQWDRSINNVTSKDGKHDVLFNFLTEWKKWHDFALDQYTRVPWAEKRKNETCPSKGGTIQPAICLLNNTTVASDTITKHPKLEDIINEMPLETKGPEEILQFLQGNYNGINASQEARDGSYIETESSMPETQQTPKSNDKRKFLTRDSVADHMSKIERINKPAGLPTPKTTPRKRKPTVKDGEGAIKQYCKGQIDRRPKKQKVAKNSAPTRVAQEQAQTEAPEPISTIDFVRISTELEDEAEPAVGSRRDPSPRAVPDARPSERISELAPIVNLNKGKERAIAPSANSTVEESSIPSFNESNSCPGSSKTVTQPQEREPGVTELDGEMSSREVLMEFAQQLQRLAEEVYNAGTEIHSAHYLAPLAESVLETSWDVDGLQQHMREQKRTFEWMRRRRESGWIKGR